MRKLLPLALPLVTLLVFTSSGQGQGPPPWVRDSANKTVTMGDPGDKVGIGTPDPWEKLHINGNLRLDGALQCSQGGCVGGAALQDNDVPGAKLRDGDVRGAKLKDNDVRGSKLQDNDVPGAKLLDGDVRGVKLKDNDVPGSKLQDNDVAGDKLKNGTILPTKLGGCAVGEILRKGAAGWECAEVGGGTITAVDAEGGLVGGGHSGAVTVKLTACPPGGVLRSMGSPGNWACDEAPRYIADSSSGLIVIPDPTSEPGWAESVRLTDCPPGSVLRSVGTARWACDAAPHYIASPSSGLVIEPWTPTSPPTKLSLLPCAEGEILKSAGPGNWMCAPEGSGLRPAAPTYPEKGSERDKQSAQQARRIDELQQWIEQQTKTIEELRHRVERLEGMRAKPTGVHEVNE